MTYYDLLEIQPSASEEVIKMAYKALVKKYHPDVYKGDKDYAEEMIQKINAAYEILSDKEKRSMYDREIGIECANNKNLKQSEVVKREKTKVKTEEKESFGCKVIYIGFSMLQAIISVFKYLLGIVILYFLIGWMTGNLREWNENIVYYSKVVIHFVNNIDIAKKYEEGSPEQAIQEYIEAVFEGDEYAALHKIVASNDGLNTMTVGIVKIFRQFQQDEVFAEMFLDMKNADYSIEKGEENQYIVTVTTCDYEMIANQVDDNLSSEAYVKRQIERRVKIAEKNLKKEFIVYMKKSDGKWYITEFQDSKQVIDSLTGNLLGNVFENVVEQIN